jgi:hypothetical protein
MRMPDDIKLIIGLGLLATVFGGAGVRAVVDHRNRNGAAKVIFSEASPRKPSA